MTKRHKSSLHPGALALVAILLGAPAAGETVEEMIHILESDGFVVTDVGRTFLGRIRIEAVADGLVREVILSRSTGEIRQDAVFRQRAAAAGVGAGPSAGTGEGRPAAKDGGS